MQRGITVVGVGVAAAPRDRVALDLSAEVRAAGAADAMAAASQALEHVRDALVAGGADPVSMATDDVSLTPVYDSWPAISGYSASIRLTCRTDDLPGAGRLLGAAVSAGGDAVRVNGVSFTVADPAALSDAARDAAWADARDRAARLAALAGRPLGSVLAVEEVPSMGPPVPRPAMAPMLAKAAEAAPVPLEPGQGAVTVSLRVRWAFA